MEFNFEKIKREMEAQQKSEKPAGFSVTRDPRTSLRKAELGPWPRNSDSRVPSSDSQNVNGRFFPYSHREVPLAKVPQMSVGHVLQPKYVPIHQEDVFKAIEVRNGKTRIPERGKTLFERLLDFLRLKFWKVNA